MVAGSMGPTGEIIEPLGSLSVKDAEDAFLEQATGLAEAGADLIWIETMSDLTKFRQPATLLPKWGCLLQLPCLLIPQEAP